MQIPKAPLTAAELEVLELLLDADPRYLSATELAMRSRELGPGPDGLTIPQVTGSLAHLAVRELVVVYRQTGAVTRYAASSLAEQTMAALRASR